LQFIPSGFHLSLEQFGEILGPTVDLAQSLILNKTEYLSLLQMTKISKENLLYRASRDGFEAQEFHRRCDGRTRTITIIKNNLEFVFGGYASSAWSSFSGWITDKNAFLFSLRKNGISCSEKFMNNSPEYALFGALEYGPTFGRGHEIYTSNQSNITNTNLRNFYPSYDVPENCEPQEFLTGCRNAWRTTEIEVYQIN
jgi:hypothetical protein